MYIYAYDRKIVPLKITDLESNTLLFLYVSIPDRSFFNVQIELTEIPLSKAHMYRAALIFRFSKLCLCPEKFSFPNLLCDLCFPQCGCIQHILFSLFVCQIGGGCLLASLSLHTYVCVCVCV